MMYGSDGDVSWQVKMFVIFRLQRKPCLSCIGELKYCSKGANRVLTKMF